MRKVIQMDTFLNLIMLSQRINEFIFSNCSKSSMPTNLSEIMPVFLMYLHCCFRVTILSVRHNWCLKLVCLMVLKPVLYNLGQQRKCQCTRLARFLLFLVSSCRIQKLSTRSSPPLPKSSILNYYK